jgi:hypothetical protein
MKYFKLLLLVTIAFFVSGCETTKTIPDTKYVFVKMPPELLEDCKVAPPPNKKDFMAAAIQDREGLLYDLNLQQMKNIAACNAAKKKAREWQEQQGTLYGTKPP